MKTIKRLVAVLLSAAFIMALVPSFAFAEGERVHYAKYDKATSVITVCADKDAVKVALKIYIDGYKRTMTWLRDDVTVTVDPENSAKEIWTIEDVTLWLGDYTVQAKYDDEWTSGEYSAPLSVNDTNNPVKFAGEVDSDEEPYDGKIVTTITAKLDSKPNKVQIVDKDGLTWTFSIDDKKVEWNDGVLKIKAVVLKAGDYTLKVRNYKEWGEGKAFTVEYKFVSDDFYVVGEVDRPGKLEDETYKLVIVGRADKVQFESEKGTYTFIREKIKPEVDKEDSTKETWTIKADLAVGHYKVNIKRGLGESAWKTALNQENKKVEFDVK